MIERPMRTLRLSHHDCRSRPELSPARALRVHRAQAKREAAQAAMLEAIGKHLTPDGRYERKALCRAIGISTDVYELAVKHLRRAGLWPYKAGLARSHGNRSGVSGAAEDKRVRSAIDATIKRIEAERDARHASADADRRRILTRLPSEPIGQRRQEPVPIEPPGWYAEARRLAVARYVREWKQGRNPLANGKYGGAA